MPTTSSSTTPPRERANALHLTIRPITLTFCLYQRMDDVEFLGAWPERGMHVGAVRRQSPARPCIPLEPSRRTWNHHLRDQCEVPRPAVRKSFRVSETFAADDNRLSLTLTRSFNLVLDADMNRWNDC